MALDFFGALACLGMALHLVSLALVATGWGWIAVDGLGTLGWALGMYMFVRRIYDARQK